MRIQIHYEAQVKALMNARPLDGQAVGGLLYAMVMGTAIITLPEPLSGLAGHAAWLSPFPALIVGGLTLWTVSRLRRLYPGASLLGVARRTVGGLGAALFAGLLIVYFLYVGSNTAFEVNDFLTNSIMAETSPLLIAVFSAAAACYAAFSGIRTLGRIAALCVVVHVISIVYVIGTTLSHLELARLLPLLGYHADGILKAALPAGGWFAETFVLAWVVSDPVPTPDQRRHAFAALALAGMLIAVSVAAVSAIAGPISEAESYPMFSLAQLSSVGTFARIDPFVAMAWLLLALVKQSALLYFCAVTAAEAMGFADYRPLLFGLALLMQSLGFGLNENYSGFVAGLTTLWPLIGLLVPTALPLGLLSLGLLHRRQRVR